MKKVWALSILLLLFASCSGNVRLEVPPPNGGGGQDQLSSPPVPTPAVPSPTPLPRPTERRIERFSYDVPSGNPFIYFIFYPSRTSTTSRDSLRQSLSTFVNSLMLRRQDYSEVTFFVNFERTRTSFAPIVFAGNSSTDRVSQSLVGAFDNLVDSDPGAEVPRNPLETFANAVSATLRIFRGQVSTHFIYIRDQDMVEALSSSALLALQSRYRESLNIRPSTEFRSQIQSLTYVSGVSRCPFAWQQAATALSPLFNSLSHKWLDLCNLQFEAGAPAWRETARVLAENIGNFQARYLLACKPLSGLSVIAGGRSLSVGRDFIFRSDTNEMVLLPPGTVNLQVADRIEVSYDCEI